MDQRQAQIRERAGLEESKLNVEFIDWLRKWGTPLAFVALLAFAGFGLYNRWQQGKKATTDSAFTEYESLLVGGEPSPDRLVALADEYSSVPGVAELARLRAADAYLESVIRGVRPGSTVKPEGEVENKDDLLTPEDRQRSLSKAGELYQRVLDDAGSRDGQTIVAINAMFGLAAVAECKGEFDQARALYERVAARAGAKYPAQAAIATARITGLPDLAKVTALLPKDQLPSIPKPEPVKVEPTAPTPTATPPVAGTPPPPTTPPTTTPTTPAGDAPKGDAPKGEAPAAPAEKPADGAPPPPKG